MTAAKTAQVRELPAIQVNFSFCVFHKSLVLGSHSIRWGSCVGGGTLGEEPQEASILCMYECKVQCEPGI